MIDSRMMQQYLLEVISANSTLSLPFGSALSELFLLIAAQVHQLAVLLSAGWIALLIWFRDWLGNSIAFVLGLGAATGISLGLMFQGWIRLTGNIAIGLFTGTAAGIAISLILKPSYGIYDSWMFLLPVVVMLASRGVTNALSMRNSGAGHGGHFLLIFSAVILTEVCLLKAFLYHEDKMPVGKVEKLSFAGIYLVSFLFSYLQPFHLFSYLLHYRDAKKSSAPFVIFQDTVVDWGPWIESLNLPLPYLSDWLVKLLTINRSQGMAEVLYIAEKYPSQLQAVEEASLKIITEDLKRLDSLEKVARVNDVLQYIPEEIDCLSKELMEVLRCVSNLAYAIQDYSYADTTAEQLEVLRRMQDRIAAFREAAISIKAAGAKDLHLLAANWSKLVKAKESSFRQHSFDTGVST